MEIAIAATFFAVSVLIAVYLLAPTFHRTAVPTGNPRDAVEAAHAAALRSLHDLELDWATGKVSDEDYRAQRTVLEAEVAAILRRLAGEGPS